MKTAKHTFLSILFLFTSIHLIAQYQPKNLTKADLKKAEEWVNTTYNSLSQDQKLGQLFIVALYTNKGENYISNVRSIVEQ